MSLSRYKTHRFVCNGVKWTLMMFERDPLCHFTDSTNFLVGLCWTERSCVCVRPRKKKVIFKRSHTSSDALKTSRISLFFAPFVFVICLKSKRYKNKRCSKHRVTYWSDYVSHLPLDDKSLGNSLFFCPFFPCLRYICFLLWVDRMITVILNRDTLIITLVKHY